VAGYAAQYVSFHISSHLWPKEVVSQHLLYFLGTKVAHQSTGMSFLQKQ
jgi:hypothetical protein